MAPLQTIWWRSLNGCVVSGAVRLNIHFGAPCSLVVGAHEVGAFLAAVPNDQATSRYIAHLKSKQSPDAGDRVVMENYSDSYLTVVTVRAMGLEMSGRYFQIEASATI